MKNLQCFSFYTPESFKKRLITLLIAVLLGLAITGCADRGNEDGAPPEAVEPAEPPDMPDNGDVYAPDDYEPAVTDLSVTDDNILEFVTLGQYMGISFDIVPAIEVTDEEVAARVNEYLGQMTTTVDVTDRAVQSGDIVNIDFEGFQDGVAFPGGTAHGFDLTIGSGMFIPGFEEQIIGHNIDDVFGIDVYFPEGYHVPELAGEPVVFRITINGIRASQMPELTDEFILSRFGVPTVEDFEEMIRSEMAADRAVSAESVARAQVWSEVSSNASVHMVPSDEVEQRISATMAQFNDFAMMSAMELEDLILEITGLSLEAFIDEEIRPAIIEEVSQDLIVRAIAVQEGILLPEDEFLERVDEIVWEFGFMSREQFFEMHGEEAVRLMLLGENVIEFVMEHAVGR